MPKAVPEPFQTLGFAGGNCDNFSNPIAALDQRKENLRLNQSLQGELEKNGLVFNTPDPSSFRAALTRAGFYSEWRARFGPEAWKLLEKYSGELA
jgi:TRAP-type transport system periplasmic protein